MHDITADCDVFDCDVLIIGAGVAGLMTALHLDAENKVLLVSAEGSDMTNSSYAQGGIAAVSERIFQHRVMQARQSHVADTLASGDGLCRLSVVDLVIGDADQAIEAMLALKVPFTTDQSQFHQGLEGGHSERRIWHVADHTGKSLAVILQQQITRTKHITQLTDQRLIRLVIDQKNILQGALLIHQTTHQLYLARAPVVVLATGGASGVYVYSSGSSVTYGEAIAIAYDVGCVAANMEFVQFHPTYFLSEQPPGGFLLSEALRGEGSKLLSEHYQPFLQKFAGDELATRDKCACAIYQQLKSQTYKRVYLDTRHRDRDYLKAHFPSIYKKCTDYGFDMATDCIPVTPVAHYTCGGIDVDTDGHTHLKNLYAVGEVAHTGLHGANRLASNSLLECLVFAKRAAVAINKRRQAVSRSTALKAPSIADILAGIKSFIPSHHLIKENWGYKKHLLQTIMWECVGILRTGDHLQTAKSYVMEQQSRYAAAKAYYMHPAAQQYFQMLATCWLIIESALTRCETRGLHIRSDYPETQAVASKTLLQKR